MAKRIVLTLTVAEYEAAKRREEAASTTPFKYNTRTNTLKINFPWLSSLVKAAKNSKRVCRDSERYFTANGL